VNLTNINHLIADCRLDRTLALRRRCAGEQRYERDLAPRPPSRYPRDVQSLGSETDELTALCCFTFFETEGKLGVFLSDRLRGWIRGVIPPRWIRRSPPAAQEADPWDRTTMPLGIATYAPWDGQ